MHSTPRSRRTLAGLLVILSCFAWGRDVRESSLTLTDYRIKEFKSDGTLAWVINGEKAITRGKDVTLTKVQMELNDGKDPMRVFTPECQFDRETKLGSSEEQVHMRSSRMTIDGVGFDVNMAERKIKIRHRVRVRIFDSGAKLLDKGEK